MVKRKGKSLIVKPDWMLNTYTVFSLKKVISDDIKKVVFDLTDTDIVDTDSIRFMYELYKSGKFVLLKNPPQMFFDVLRTLEIENILLKKIKENEYQVSPQLP